MPITLFGYCRRGAACCTRGVVAIAEQIVKDWHDPNVNYGGHLAYPMQTHLGGDIAMLVARQAREREQQQRYLALK